MYPNMRPTFGVLGAYALPISSNGGPTSKGREKKGREEREGGLPIKGRRKGEGPTSMGTDLREERGDGKGYFPNVKLSIE